MTLATTLSASRFEERLEPVKGVRLRWFVGGEGPPLALLHGLGGAASNWIELAPELARESRVIAVDLPGHGGSAALSALPNLEPFADRVGLVLEREGAHPAVLVGHSLGCVVALRLAMRSPELVRGLVLIAAAGIGSTTRRARYALAVSSLIQPGRLLARFRERVARSELLRAVVWGSWATPDGTTISPTATLGLLEGPSLHTDTASAAAALVEEDPRVDLDRVRCPGMLVWGSRDPQVPVDDAFEYARRLRAPLRVVAGAGHLVIAERPAACLDAIGSFLDGIS
ncbi:MAG TPA: alpha/beta fold hydrolase [Gaiellaceae bacterium]|nr:alpha/beta fold hydrolase [Gaiellaceae bacterium]